MIYNNPKENDDLGEEFSYGIKLENIPGLN